MRQFPSVAIVVAASFWFVAIPTTSVAASSLPAINFAASVPGSVLTDPPQTLYVNKYSPNESTVPGCASAPYSAIGTDSAPGSGAVADAQSGDTIFICGSPNASSDPYTPATAVLGAKSLTFVGEGPTRTILDGENDRTLIFANACTSGSSYLNLQSLTVRRGRDINDGGGIEANCRDMALSNVHFIDNKATGFGTNGGGGIALFDAGYPELDDITVTNSVFTGNIAEYDSGSAQFGSDGGGIRTTGSVTVTDSRFENNEARATAASPKAPRGGVIWAGAGVSITESTFKSNVASGPHAFGGAIYAEYGGAQLSRSTFVDNASVGFESAAAAVGRFAGGMTVSNSTFTGNTASSFSVLSSSDSFTLTNTTSSGNTSGVAGVMYSGGGLTIGNSIIDEAGESCTAAVPADNVNAGGNVISASATGCDPFVGGGGAPATKVSAGAIDLQALASNGGPTQTMAIRSTSVAASSAAANLLGPSPTDQRGFARPLMNQSSGAFQTIAPVNTGAPEITGTARVGQTLTTSNGTWLTPTPTFSYQWVRCDSAGSNCSNISGATSQTYPLVQADAGSATRVVVTADNGIAPNGTATSMATSTVVQPPTNSVVPRISGAPQVGQSLTADGGVWSGYPAPSLGYQWQLCDAAGSSCADIRGAAEQTYTPIRGDEGKKVRIIVTASNSEGSVSANSLTTADVEPARDPPGPAPDPPGPDNRARVTKSNPVGDALVTRVTVPGPGVIAQRGTFGRSVTRGASRGSGKTACRTTRTTTREGTYTLKCRLNSMARKARLKGRLRVLARTTFTPTGGTGRTTARTVVFSSLKPRFTG